MILCSSEAQTQALRRRRTAAVGGSESSCPFEPRRKRSAGMKAEERESGKHQKESDKNTFYLCFCGAAVGEESSPRDSCDAAGCCLFVFLAASGEKVFQFRTIWFKSIR